MKVKAWLDQEIEVNVTIQDMIDSLYELPDIERPKSLLSAINAGYTVISMIPDASIDEMTPAARLLIYEGLTKQAARYRPPGE